MRIDLNADLGEGAGHDLELLDLVSSANISCGAHAGEPALILQTIRDASARGVATGAHPSYPDRARFGREELPTAPGEITALVAEQLATFAAWVREAGTVWSHVKPHGALYNAAARDRRVAEEVVNAITKREEALRLFAPAGSALARAGEEAGLRVVAEFFADRNYLADGSLAPRSHPQAILHDAEAAAGRLLQVLATGFVSSLDGKLLPMHPGTICLHGDSPEAVSFARALRRRLQVAGVEVAPAG